jgi:predicted DNA-binding transcriptional regulator AlpA
MTHQTVLTPGGFLRLNQIVNDAKTGERGLIPVSRATWWRWVLKGIAPAACKLGPGVTAWRTDDIAAFIAKGGVA